MLFVLHVALLCVRVAVIGAGNVGSMLIDLLLRSGLSKEDILATVRSEERLKEVSSKFGVRVMRDNREAARNADIVFLCVKPSDLFEVLYSIRYCVREKLVVSCVALVPEWVVRSRGECDYVCRLLPVLTYPFTRPILFLYRGTAQDSHVDLLRGILRDAEIVDVESEHVLDLLTVYASSGIAFLYYLAKSYVWGGVAIGLDFKRAQKVLSMLIRKVAELLSKDVDEESVLRRVATPGGITITGVSEAELRSLRGGIMRMLVEAWEKARRIYEDIVRFA